MIYSQVIYISKAICMLFCLLALLAVYSMKANAYDISRAQVRAMDDGSFGASLSSFWAFSNGVFILPIYEADYKNQTSGRLDIMVGHDISDDKSLGAIYRYQNIKWEKDSISFGLQYNLHKNYFIGDLLNSYCIKSFVQLYKNNGLPDITGDYEIYLRLQSGCGHNVYHRGVIQSLFHTEVGEQMLITNDFYYRVNKYSEIYLRHQYLSDDNLAYGREGSSIGIGLRFSTSFGT